MTYAVLFGTPFVGHDIIRVNTQAMRFFPVEPWPAFSRPPLSPSLLHIRLDLKVV